MVKLLNEVGLNLSSSSECEIARKIKEELCYVAIDPIAEEQRTPPPIQFIKTPIRKTPHTNSPMAGLSPSVVKSTAVQRHSSTR